jgi:hypothetical protein
MVKASRSAVKTLTLNKSRDIVVDRLLKSCVEGNHSKCTGWAVLRKEVSPIDANFFLRCTCPCHHKKEHKQIKKKQTSKKQLKKRVKKKAKKQKLGKKSKKSKRSRKARRR